MSGTTTNEVNHNDEQMDASDYYATVAVYVEHASMHVWFLRRHLPNAYSYRVGQKVRQSLMDARWALTEARAHYKREHGYMPALMG